MHLAHLLEVVRGHLLHRLERRGAMMLRRLLRHETILAVLVVLTLAVLAQRSDRFYTIDNLLNQGRLMAEVGLVPFVHSVAEAAALAAAGPSARLISRRLVIGSATCAVAASQAAP